MADVMVINFFQEPPPFRNLIAAVFVVLAPFAWSQQLSYVGIEREHPSPELSNQYDVKFLGSSFGTTMTTRSSRPMKNFLRTFFQDRKTHGSLQVEYELKTHDNGSRRAVGIYERYRKERRGSPLTLVSKSISTEFLSVVNSRFRTGAMLPDDSLTLSLTLASYSSEIALGLEQFIDDASLERVEGNLAEAKFALASQAIAAFSRDRSALSEKTVALYGRDLLRYEYIVFYLAAPGSFEKRNLEGRLAEKLRAEGRGEINTNLVDDPSWFGNAVFLIEREVTPCDRNRTQESKERCHAVSKFMKEWVDHVDTSRGPSQGDDRKLIWRHDGEEISGTLAEFFAEFDLSFAIGNYGKVDEDRWSARGAIKVDDVGDTRNGEEQPTCLEDVSVKFTFERGSADIIRAELDIGVHPLADGRRPSSDDPKRQCKD